MGQYHILALAELWTLDLVAICDTDVERARSVASQYSVRSVSTHHELAGLVDIATVAVPTDRHFEVARELLEAGVDRTRREAHDVDAGGGQGAFRIARQLGRAPPRGPTSKRFNGAVQELRKIVERPVLVESRRLGPSSPACRATPWSWTS